MSARQAHHHASEVGPLRPGSPLSPFDSPGLHSVSPTTRELRAAAAASPHAPSISPPTHCDHTGFYSLRQNDTLQQPAFSPVPAPNSPVTELEALDRALLELQSLPPVRSSDDEPLTQAPSPPCALINSEPATDHLYSRPVYHHTECDSPVSDQQHLKETCHAGLRADLLNQEAPSAVPVTPCSATLEPESDASSGDSSCRVAVQAPDVVGCCDEEGNQFARENKRLFWVRVRWKVRAVNR